MWTSEALAFYQQNVMCNSGGKLEVQDGDRNVDSEGQAHEVSGRSTDSIGNWTISHFHVIFLH